MDLRGHGLSDAPTEDGAYDLDGPRRGRRRRRRGLRAARRRLDDRVVLAGHGFGAIVAAGPRPALGRAVRRSRPRRRRLGVARGVDRPRRRRVPARPRRAARGAALDGGLPRRPGRLRSRRPGTPTRSARRGPRSSRRTPAASSRSRGRTCSRRASARCSPTTRSRRCAPVAAPVVALAAAAVGRRRARRPRPGPRRRERRPRGRRPRSDPRRVVRPRRPQPDALPSGRGQRGDPVGRRRGRASLAEPLRTRCRSSTRRPTSATTSPSRRSWAWPIPANEVAERAEIIRATLDADGGLRAWRADRARRGADHRRPRPGPGPRSSRSPGPRSRRQALAVPFLSADTYPNRAMFEGMSDEAVAAPRPRAGARRRPGRVLGPGLGRAAGRRHVRGRARRPSTSR